MATKLYLNSFRPTDLTPDPDPIWDDANDPDGYLRSSISTERGYDAESQDFVDWGSAYCGSCSFSVASWPRCSLGKQYIYGPLAAQEISGTVNGLISTFESMVAASLYMAVVIRVLSNDFATVRGTLLSQLGDTPDHTALPTGTAWTDDFISRYCPKSASVTPVNAQEGDYLVIEVGCVCRAATGITGRGLFICWDSHDVLDYEEELSYQGEHQSSQYALDDYIQWMEFSADIALGEEGGGEETESAGGFVLGSDSEPVFSERPGLTVTLEPGSVTASYGGFIMSGVNAVEFSTPEAFIVETSGGMKLSGANFPLFIKPTATPIRVRGGFKLGGSNTTVFITPGEAVEGAESLYTAIVRGGFVIGGSPQIVFISPTKLTLQTSGGFKLGGKFITGISFITPSESAITSTLLASKGGFVMGGLNFPVFTKPKVYEVPVDGRIIAALFLGGGGGAAFITPVVYEATNEGEIVLGAGTDLKHDRSYDTWVLDGKSYEPSIFSGWMFNSFAVLNGKVYGASVQGLYILEGVDDDGTPIRTGIRIGPINFGNDGDKRLRSINFGKAGTKTVVRVETKGRERIFTVKREPNRVTVSRDLQGNEFIIDIAEFEELSHLEIVPLMLARR
jgi:hypothetical protein